MVRESRLGPWLKLLRSSALAGTRLTLTMLLWDLVYVMRLGPLIMSLLLALSRLMTLRCLIDLIPPGWRATLRKYFVYWPFFFS